jgi:hypothetical protein
MEMNSFPLILLPVEFFAEVTSITMLNQELENNTILLTNVHLNAKSKILNENQTTNLDQCMMDIELIVDSLKSSMMEATKFRTFASIPKERAAIQKFHLSVGDVAILAKFNELNWLRVLGMDVGSREGSKIPLIAMPYAYISAMNVNIKCEGKVLESSNSIFVKDFSGDHKTNSHDISEHFKKCFISKLPSFVLNTEIMGQKLADKTAMGVGVMAMSSAPLGSVSSLVVVDTIRGAVAAGKESRGVDVSEKYKFGDFTRGALHSLQKASAKGANLRRGESEHYEIGDFTVGLASTSKEYVGQNKARLGSAAASGVGMMVGLAVAGPVGLLAGSYAGASLGRQTFEVTNTQASDSGRSQNGESQGMPDGAIQNKSPSVEVCIPNSQQHRSDIKNSTPRNTSTLPTDISTQHTPKKQQKEGYRFGDITRSLFSGPKR